MFIRPKYLLFFVLGLCIFAEFSFAQRLSVSSASPSSSGSTTSYLDSSQPVARDPLEPEGGNAGLALVQGYQAMLL